MSSLVNRLYGPLIERDFDTIRKIVPALASEATPEDVWRAITGFALLAYNPSQDSKHALLACVAANELRHQLGTAYVAALTECACYVSDARAPWSEPPIITVPEPADPLPLSTLERALERRDRDGVEEWIASQRGSGLTRSLFNAAARLPGESGHNVIIAAAVLRLTELFPHEQQWGLLRVLALEWSAADAAVISRAGTGERDLDAILLQEAIDGLVTSGGSANAFHALELFSAGFSLQIATEDAAASRRVGGTVAELIGSAAGDGPAASAEGPADELPVYRYSTDFAQLLLSVAIREQLQPSFPNVPLDDAVRVSGYNLLQLNQEAR